MQPTDTAELAAAKRERNAIAARLERLDSDRLDFLIKHFHWGKGQLDRDPRNIIDEAMRKRCGSCGNPIAGFKGNKIYCSVKCANRISKRMQREREKRNLNDRQTQDNKCIC